MAPKLERIGGLDVVVAVKKDSGLARSAGPLGIDGGCPSVSMISAVSPAASILSLRKRPQRKTSLLYCGSVEIEGIRK
jgi:hypothetical protein